MSINQRAALIGPVDEVRRLTYFFPTD